MRVHNLTGLFLLIIFKRVVPFLLYGIFIVLWWILFAPPPKGFFLHIERFYKTRFRARKSLLSALGAKCRLLLSTFILFTVVFYGLCDNILKARVYNFSWRSGISGNLFWFCYSMKFVIKVAYFLTITL